MIRDGEAGQAAVDTIAGAGLLLVLAAVIMHVVALLAAAGALQTQTREAAIMEAASSSGAASVARSHAVEGPLPGLGATRLTARAAVRDPSK